MPDPVAERIDVTQRSVYTRTAGVDHDPLQGPRTPRDDRGREVAPDLLALVGETPLVALDRISADVPPTLLAKLEYLNPGGSVKDRIGIAMIEAAETADLLRPGGTIVEPTSGNTGVGLAIAAARKGYRCIFVVPDKVSQDKITLMRAYGAEVVVCPTAVEPEDPRSYYSVSDRLTAETPGAFKPNQYFAAANPMTHELSTGPELWRQTAGLIDVLVAGVGTGGTVTGVGRYLKARKPEVQIVGADPEGSVFSGEAHPYLVEGIGEDFWPESFDPSLVDRYVRISDRDSFLAARRVAREEGILVGGSCGTAVHAALEVARDLPEDATVVVLFPDSGRNYLSKLYDDHWMVEHGFFERTGAATLVGDVLRIKAAEPDVRNLPDVVHCHAYQSVAQAIALLKEFSVSQVPVVREEVERAGATHVGEIIGSIRERELLDHALTDPTVMQRPVVEAMQPPLPVVDVGEPLDDVFSDLAAGSPAVVVADAGLAVGVLTRADLLEHLAGTG